MSDHLPRLDAIVSKCYKLGITQNTSASAETFCSALALLGHLKIERELIRVMSKTSQLQEVPSPANLPAMTAVLQDDDLFRALLRCLRSSGLENGGHHEQHVNSRKRSISVSAEPPSKQIKLNTGVRKQTSEHQQLGMFWPGLVSAIFVCALGHLDHWPACLVEIYAQDSFGPRAWVDHPACSLLVKNLSLALVSTKDPRLSEGRDDAASLVAEAYRDYSIGEDSLQITCSAKDGNNSPLSPKRHGCFTPKSGALNKSLSSTLVNASNDGEKGTNGVIVRDGDDDSSSGSEGEEIVVDTQTVTSAEKSLARVGSTENHVRRKDSGLHIEASVGRYPLHIQESLCTHQVKNRFFGSNRALAHNLIGNALSARLSIKSKQNSSLLQTLPEFTSISSVRKQVAAHLERWLQSPALAGLARQLFTSTVQNLEKSDPPLTDDLDTIDAIVRMRLRANQLNAHVENITAIASILPSSVVVSRMYAELLRQAMDSLQQQVSKQPSSYLCMVMAVHRKVAARTSYDAMAASILSMLITLEDKESKERLNRERVVRRLRQLIRAVAAQLGMLFDSFALMESLLSFDIDVKSWSTKDEEDKAKLLFQCVTLFVGKYVTSSELDRSKLMQNEESLASLKSKFRVARCMLLQWCCGEYGSKCRERLDRKSALKKNVEDSLVLGAGEPDFASILQDKDIKLHAWLKIARCVLFLEGPDSSLLRQFVCPGESPEDEEDWKTELARIRVCVKHGVDVDDDLLWIVVKSSADQNQGLSSEMAVQLLEHLIQCCGAPGNGTLSVSDPMLLWEMYSISEYNPPRNLLRRCEKDADKNQTVVPEIPKLAYPGLWWRINVLALIICAASPEKIGQMMWSEHPTMRSILKMITSMQFKFPTVDCSDGVRKEMKKKDHAARDEEIRIAELLFLPKRQERPQATSKQAGSRVSKRILKQRKERAEAEELAEANKRRELLRNGQRSIMLWDPDGPARKPPKEIGDLLLTVEHSFCMSDIFQRSRSPDFVLKTIGETSRGAIERAHGWLIPIISKFPDTIERLPPNATCFLLLQSYGNFTESGSQLKSLSRPLLEHVKLSLLGKFGEENATEALDLLLGDVASRDQDKRRCARRVLNDTLSNAGDDSTPWISSILLLEHATALVPCTIKHMSVAAEFESGLSLESLLTGLHQHIAFAESKCVEVQSNFSALLVRLVSTRPSVYVELLYESKEFRQLSAEIFYTEFLKRCGKDSQESVVEVDLFESPLGSGKVILPRMLLESICVLLSVWQDKENSDDSREKINKILNALMLPDTDDGILEPDKGLCTGKIPSSRKDAILVESWILLSKAQNENIARRAALSAPLTFLPRLLLCSGLPKTSFVTMVGRVEKLWETSDSKEESFRRILCPPPSSSDWDIGRVGNRKDFAKKLLLRLRAYFRHFLLGSGESTAFMQHLASEVKRDKTPKPKRPRNKKSSKSAAAMHMRSVESVGGILGMVGQFAPASSPAVELSEVDESGFVEFRIMSSKSIPTVTDPSSLTESCAHSSDLHLLDHLLAKVDKKLSTEYAICLLRSFDDTKARDTDTHLKFLEKWVPLLSREEENPELWKLLFLAPNERPLNLARKRMILRCAASWRLTVSKSCIAWLLLRENNSKSDPDVAISFITAVSGASTSPTSNTYDAKKLVFDISDKGHCTDVIRVALTSYLSCFRGGAVKEVSLPPVNLLFCVAGCGKTYLQLTVDTICELALDSKGNTPTREALQSLLLRLYFAYPLWMNLGSPMIRTGLINASQLHRSSWHCFYSTLDNQVEDVLSGLFEGETRLGKRLSDLTRKHPLVLFRKTHAIVARLRRDATPSYVESSRGVVNGCISLVAAPPGQHTVKINIRHWGCVFTEPVWVVLLDVFSAVPRELLLGKNLGLYNILGVYLQLISVQMHLNTREKIVRLRSKMDNCFSALKQDNNDTWKEWLDSTIDDMEVRNLLVSCDFLSPQEAIDSLKET